MKTKHFKTGDFVVDLDGDYGFVIESNDKTFVVLYLFDKEGPFESFDCYFNQNKNDFFIKKIS